MLDPVEVINELSLDDIRRVLRKELLEDLSSDLITLDEILRLARGTDPRRWRRGGSAALPIPLFIEKTPTSLA